LNPKRSDRLYLLLRRLRDDLAAAVRASDARDVLDVYCGSRPYEPLFPAGTRYVGLDIDDSYGCADVVSDEFLPFPDRVFDLCLCTQSFQFIPNPEAAIAEFRRVLRPGGHVLLTLALAYPGTVRLYSPLQLREAFAGWENVVIVESGGTIVSLVTISAHFVHQIEKRLTGRLKPLFRVSYATMNTVGEVADSFEHRFLAAAPKMPTNLLLSATAPRG
jgi:SAM-dependent methyltransferase